MTAPNGRTGDLTGELMKRPNHTISGAVCVPRDLRPFRQEPDDQIDRLASCCADVCLLGISSYSSLATGLGPKLKLLFSLLL